MNMLDVIPYVWIIWLVVIFLFVIVELLTLEFTFLMIAVGSLGGLGANLLGWPWWAQILIAAALSALLLFTIRPLLLKTLHKGADPTPSNVAALMGLSGQVLTPVGDTQGLVKLANGETWTARTSPALPDVIIDEGERVRVSDIQGSIAFVIPAERTPAS